MDHADALELIEIAAAEPGGLERLAAGDTPEAAVVAGHLAGCASCADALVRTTRTAELARAVIRELPDPALRARTLAFVREVGRDRSGAGATAAIPGSSVAGSAAEAQAMEPLHVVAVARRRRASWLVLGLAAALVVATIAGFTAGTVIRQPAPGVEDVANAVAVMQATMSIAGRPDAVRIALAPAGGGAAAGTVLFSPSGGQLAMVVTGMAPAPAGATYACWIESGGMRRRIGVVYADERTGVGSWAGPVSGLDGLAPGSTFGVSLVTAGSQSGTPVLIGG